MGERQASPFSEVCPERDYNRCTLERFRLVQHHRHQAARRGPVARDIQRDPGLECSSSAKVLPVAYLLEANQVRTQPRKSGLHRRRHTLEVALR